MAPDSSFSGPGHSRPDLLGCTRPTPRRCISAMHVHLSLMPVLRSTTRSGHASHAASKYSTPSAHTSDEIEYGLQNLDFDSTCIQNSGRSCCNGWLAVLYARACEKVSGFGTGVKCRDSKDKMDDVRIWLTRALEVGYLQPARMVG